MTTPEVIALLFGGGALWKFLEYFLGHWFARPKLAAEAEKALRDELRADLTRLEACVKELDAKIDHLELEVETWKNKVDEWRAKYYDLLHQYKLLESVVAVKDATIEDLRARLAPKQGATNA